MRSATVCTCCSIRYKASDLEVKVGLVRWHNTFPLCARPFSLPDPEETPHKSLCHARIPPQIRRHASKEPEQPHRIRIPLQGALERRCRAHHSHGGHLNLKLLLHGGPCHQLVLQRAPAGTRTRDAHAEVPPIVVHIPALLQTDLAR